MSLKALDSRLTTLEGKFDALKTIISLDERVSADGTELIVISLPDGSEYKMMASTFYKSGFRNVSNNEDVLSSNENGVILVEANNITLTIPNDLGWNVGSKALVIVYGTGFTLANGSSVTVNNPQDFQDINKSQYLITKTAANIYSVVQYGAETNTTTSDDAHVVADISGTYDVDHTKKSFELTMTANTTLNNTGLPSLGKSTNTTIYLTGAFTPTFSDFTTRGDAYSGSVWNRIDVFYSGDNAFYDAKLENLSSTPSTRETHVFVLGGQSNMRPNTGTTGSSQTEVYPAFTYQWGRFGANNNTIIDAAVPLDHIGNDSAPQYGPGLATKFCIDYAADNPNVNILLVPCAEGGTSFQANDWNQGDPNYNDLVNRTNQVFIENPTYKLKAILWHQGESDSGNSGYETDLDTFISNVRTDITVADANTPIILGGQLPSWIDSSSNNLAVYNIVKDTPNRVSNTAFADSRVPTDLTGIDAFHFSSSSSLTLGERYYEAYKTLGGEEGALAHWLFGTDNPNYESLINSSDVLSPNGLTPTLNTNSVTTPDGGFNGLISTFPETLALTLVVVCDVRDTDKSFIFGNYGSTSPRGIVAFYNGNNIVSFNADNNGHSLHSRTKSLILTDKVFIAYTTDASGNWLEYLGDTGGADTYSGTDARTAGNMNSSINLGIGNLGFSGSAFDNGLTFYEFIIYDGVKTSTEIGEIYERSKVRMSNRGITIL